MASPVSRCSLQLLPGIAVRDLLQKCHAALIVSLRLLVGGEAYSPVARLDVIGDGLLRQIGLLAVPGETPGNGCEPVRMIGVGGFQVSGCRFVQVCPFHSIQLPVKILLEQRMVEAVASQSRFTEVVDSFCNDKAAPVC